MYHSLLVNSRFNTTRYKLCCLLVITSVYVLWWGWIRSFPMALTSDDALNFSRGVVRFSVLEFRPHFPGYPAFIGFARLAAVWVDTTMAPIWVSLLSAMMIPVLVARLVLLLCGSWTAATFGCLLALGQPLLASIALSGLSDSAAIMLFLMALIAAMQQKNGWVGLWLGLMLATRPSYMPLAFAMLLVPYLGDRTGSTIRAYLQASVVIAVIGVSCLLFIWAHDGAAYFEEGRRFTLGHFSIWGNTAEGNTNSLHQWYVSLNKGFGWAGIGCAALSLFCAMYSGLSSKFGLRVNHSASHGIKQKLALIAAIAGMYWLWVTVGQNPDNLRHWAPVLFSFLVVFSVQLALLAHGDTANEWLINPAYICAVGAVLYCFTLGYQTYSSVQRQAPIQQAIVWIKAHPQVNIVGTNYSVNLLRDQLASYSIYDMYYPSSKWALRAAAKQAPKSAWRLSGTRLDQQTLVTQFLPRFIGERRLFLYQISQ